MKNNVTDNLNELFEIKSELVDDEKNEVLAPIDKGDDITTDYEFARNNIHNAISKGSEALDYLLEIAKQSDHPRAFEVVGQLTKTLVDANKDLLDVQKKVKDLKVEDTSPDTVNNNLFVGSTADILKMLKGDDNGDRNV
jgi:hypothetical protein